MAWKATLIVDQREEFVHLARVPGANVSQLCERFEISRTTGPKWWARFAAEGHPGWEVEQRMAEWLGEHPAWGGRKLRKRLSVLETVSADKLPAVSTITE